MGSHRCDVYRKKAVLFSHAHALSVQLCPQACAQFGPPIIPHILGKGAGVVDNRALLHTRGPMKR